MENLKKFSRYAPYFTIAIFAIIFSIWAIDMQVFIKNNERSPEYGIYIFVDAISLIAAPIQYLWWLGTSLFAKLVKRSPAIPLVMSFFSPLRTLGLIGVVHFFGFILAGLYRLGNPL